MEWQDIILWFVLAVVIYFGWYAFQQTLTYRRISRWLSDRFS